MDYNAEMLNLYFKEKGFSEEKINRLLEENPFDGYYSNWEQQTKYNNRTFAEVIRRNGEIQIGTIVQEIGVHKDNSVAKYLTKNIWFSQLSAKGNLIRIKTIPGRLVIFKGIYKNELDFLKRLEETRTPYITGICTTEQSFLNRSLDEYRSFQSKLKNTKLIQIKNDYQKILILRHK